MTYQKWFPNLEIFLRLHPMFPAGRGEESNLHITGEEYYRALVCVDGVNPLSSLNITLAHGRRKRVTRCAMASSEISIDENGDGIHRISSLRKEVLRGEYLQKLYRGYL